VTEWSEWSEAEAAAKWDSALTALPSYNLYQSYGWGEFKRRHGWTVRRGSIVVDGAREAMAQCLVREVPAVRITVVWVPGGPAGSAKGRRRLGQALRQHYPYCFFYLRANILEEDRAEERNGLTASGWVPSRAKVSQPVTFHLDLVPDEVTRRNALSGNWRHNLNRGEERGGTVKVWEPAQPLDSVYAVYSDMVRLKEIPPAVSLGELDALRRALGRSFTLAVALGADGSPCAVRGFGRIGTRAHDLIAGVSEAGRKIYANYHLTWQLLGLAREQGVLVYDMGGVDWERAAGVSNFKKGLGGRVVSVVGEWEWTNAGWLRWGMNLAIRFRRARL